MVPMDAKRLGYRGGAKGMQEEIAYNGCMNRGGKPMEVLILLGILVAWFILQAWVLPRLGVKT
jgi:hypothetical protein